jgi:hypothetical protein
LKNELKHFENLLYLTEAVAKYIDETDKNPDEDLRDLVRYGIIKSVPEDVFGGYYYYDKEDGKVKTTTDGDRVYRRRQEEKKALEKEGKKLPDENPVNIKPEVLEL